MNLKNNLEIIIIFNMIKNLVKHINFNALEVKNFMLILACNIKILKEPNN